MEVGSRPGGVVGGEGLVAVGVVADKGAVGVQFVGQLVEGVPFEAGFRGPKGGAEAAAVTVVLVGGGACRGGGRGGAATSGVGEGCAAGGEGLTLRIVGVGCGAAGGGGLGALAFGVVSVGCGCSVADFGENVAGVVVGPFQDFAAGGAGGGVTGLCKPVPGVVAERVGCTVRASDGQGVARGVVGVRLVRSIATVVASVIRVSRPRLS